ncbi:MAG TPA: glycosyltransferase family 2 protein [Verrucomicrobiae bacterium]
MTTSQPLLTISIPTYNRAKLLEARLLELLPQVVPEVELIVCNDGSTDETVQVCEKYRNQGVLYYENKVNMGLSRNMLSAFENARGKWLWTLGDDDGVLPDAVGRILLLLRKYPEAGVITVKNETLHFTHEKEFHDLGTFLQEHGITDVMFQSSNLYHIARINKHLKVFAQGIITISPHVDLIIRMLETHTASLQFSQTEILGECEANRRWSSLELAFGVSLHPIFIRSHSIQKRAAMSAWFKTRWMHKYGLREVHDEASFTRWKQLTRNCDSLLNSFGAHFLSVLFFNQFEMKEWLNHLQMSVIRLFPFSMVKRPILEMRNRRLGDRISYDN